MDEWFNYCSSIFFVLFFTNRVDRGYYWCNSYSNDNDKKEIDKMFWSTTFLFRDPCQSPPWENSDQFDTGNKKNNTRKIKAMSKSARKRKSKKRR